MSNSSKDSFWAELESKLKEGLANLNSSPTDYHPILNQLQALTQLTVEDDFRYQVLSYSNLNWLIDFWLNKFRSSIPNEILQILLTIIQRPVGVPLVLECARILRNCCGKNWESFPDTWNQLLSECNQLLESFILKEFPVEEIILARVILQCVGNILNTHTNLSHIVWESLQSHFRYDLWKKNYSISIHDFRLSLVNCFPMKMKK